MMPDMGTQQLATGHYWLPIANTGTGCTRHAFAGRRWDGSPAAITICGETVPMAEPSEMDWIMGPSCAACRESLKAKISDQ